MDELELKGEWWLKEMAEDSDDIIPDDAVAGTLSFSPETGGNLELIGGFYHPFELFKDDDEDTNGPVTIHGVSTDGEYVSLLDCMYTNGGANSKDITFRTETYEIGQIIRGGFVDKNTRYWKCSFSFDNLDKWTGLRTVAVPGDFDVAPGPSLTAEASTDEADIILNVHEDIHYPVGTPVGRVYFTVYVDQPLTQKEFSSRYIRPLQNLVTLGVGEPVFPTFLNLYSERYGPYESQHKATHRVSYYREQEDISSQQMDFTLQDLDFETSVKQWHTHYNDVKRLHHNYFGTEYNDKMYVRTQFFSLMSALEAYHRAAFPDRQKIMTKSVFDRFKSTLFPRIPSVAARERIENLVNSIGNEPSIGDRLLDITGRHESVFPREYDIESNLSTIKKIRHNIVHSLSEEYTTTEIAEAKILLRIVVLAVLLDTVGLDDAKSREILKEEYESADRIVPL
ncbi:hypothetical protein OB919_16035 [Halobacteria archaeon AArc-curdl1]|uniref:ApeA N-terminal domain-containing protein n=1 Tax=Natronosalvus hydrolyticus TaxID=2979988 RepID=A0AAP3E814_9EURY|nr:hypothetical protein [Halobacteria archaeon AArc-curdl1]